MRPITEYLALTGAESRICLYPIDETAPQDADLYDLGIHAWAARQVFRLSPDWLLDIGGGKPFVSIMAQFCPTISLDVRPWAHSIPGLRVAYGDVTALPYESGSVPCACCLSVIEHVSLSRYDDSLDPLGSIKACRELGRVVAPGGSLIIAVPVSHTSGLAYCAHRLFTRAQILGYLPGFRVQEEVTLYPEPGPAENVSRLGEWQYAMGCYHLVREG